MKSLETNLARTIPVLSTAPPATTSATTEHRRGRLLFALSEDGEPTASLQRAFHFCESLDAELHVLRVLPELTNLNPVFPHLNVLDAMHAVDRTLAALHSTQAWLEGTDASRFATSPVEVRSGGFVEQVASRAAEMGAELIVLPPYEGSLGSTATTLARTSRVPVLVARGPDAHRGILVASDLQDPEYPVLQLAETIAFHFDAPIVALHNVAPIPISFGLDVVWPTVVPMQEVTRLVQSKLDRATERWQVVSRSVIALESNPVDAILKEARSWNADLIVVGTRPHSWFDRIFGSSTADQVIAQAQRSVLVTPLDTYN